MDYTSLQKGRHSELLSIAALVANHFDVAEPVTTEGYDLVICDPVDKTWKKAQVKTCIPRKDRDALVVYTKKNDGKAYSLQEVDVFLTVLDGDVYLFENRELKENWATRRNIGKKWRKLSTQLA